MNKLLAASLLCALTLSCGPRSGPVTPAAKPTPSGDLEAWRKSRPPTGEASRFVYPAPETLRLSNGLRVYAVKRAGGITVLSLVTRRGASSLPAGKSGLAALTARMLTEGTRRRSSLELAEAAESLGSTLESDAGRDYADVSLATLREDVVRGLELIAEVVLEPAFAPQELERVRSEWLDGLRAERQDPRRLASLAALRLLFGEEHGAPVSGSIKDVQKLSTADLAAFHKSAFVPASSALIVAGDITLAELARDVERLFGSWQGRAGPATPSPEPPRLESTRVVVVDRPGSVQTALFVAQPFPKRSVEGWEARELLSSVVGGLFTSRINQNLREEHAYTYGASSQALATRGWGAFVVQTSVETPTTADAISQIVLELGRARDPALGHPIKNEELVRARADQINGLGSHLEHANRMAHDLQQLFVFELPDDYFARFATTIGAVSPQAVTGEAQRLTPDRLLVVAVGDRGQIAPNLEAKRFKLERADERLLE